MIDWYQDLVKSGILQADAQQAAVVEILASFGKSLLKDDPGDDWRGKLQQWLNSDIVTAEKRGIYLYGGVGRGKSFLMDGFYLNLPLEKKMRVHFHQFMRHLHADMKENEQRHDPLLHVADNIIARTELICFDEFHVSDITDAMILGRLLQRLLEGGVRFVMTSNYPPAGLYPNGLARDRFLPAIALLEQHLHIVPLDGDKDYRQDVLADQPAYFTPWRDQDCRQAMQALFDELACGIVLQKNIKLSGRQVQAVARTSDCIWFDFDALCRQARSQTDYLQLADRFSTLFVSAVPRLDADDLAEAARRFTWLVDILYDARVRLILGAETPLADLYGDKEGGESGRTLSRLLEMQSAGYGAKAGNI